MAGAGLALGRHADEIDRSLDQRPEQVDVVVVVDALQHGRDALQPHAGIDRRARQVDARFPRELLVLHEDEVPHLDEAVAVLVGRARRTAGNALAVIVEDLRAWPARAGVAHLPEIVGAGDADDAALRQPGNLAPQVEGLIVVDIDGRDQLLRRQPELLGDELPGEFNRLFLEVIAKGEVAEHLEEGVMPGGVADIVEIVVLAARAHALLRGRGAWKGRLHAAGEIVLERHHAGIGEHQCRIVARHQRARRNRRVAVLLEEAKKMGPDVVDATHDRQGFSGKAGNAATAGFYSPGGGPVQYSRRSSGRKAHPPLFIQRPARIPGNLPGVAVGIGEIARIAAPEDVLRRLEDGGAGRHSLGQHRIDLCL